MAMKGPLSSRDRPRYVLLTKYGANDGGSTIEADIHLEKRPELFRQTEPPLFRRFRKDGPATALRRTQPDGLDEIRHAMIRKSAFVRPAGCVVVPSVANWTAAPLLEPSAS
jgi:hypothetical protein